MDVGKCPVEGCTWNHPLTDGFTRWNYGCWFGDKRTDTNNLPEATQGRSRNMHTTERSFPEWPGRNPLESEILLGFLSFWP